MTTFSTVHFSSQSCEWPTPQWLFDELNKEFNFDLDACATKKNAKCKRYYAVNSLQKEWTGRVWCNPPYGREIGSWVEKGFDSAVDYGSLVVMLLPARTDTKWFHSYCAHGEIRFIKGRLKFGNAKFNAPFPSMIVIFKG